MLPLLVSQSTEFVICIFTNTSNTLHQRIIPVIAHGHNTTVTSFIEFVFLKKSSCKTNIVFLLKCIFPSINLFSQTSQDETPIEQDNR